ncbi:GTP-binding protein rho5 [Coprinopsis sp. MPI-PUGE-AT-0042]|nr:GTP-binding protein rho5 [Coprinopsis sp. MPI-PUGE-AT-0042]
MSTFTIKRKLVVIGDGACGKVNMPIAAYALGRFPWGTGLPGIFDAYVARIEVDGKIVELGFFDATASDEYEQLRPLHYLGAHIILICFAVDSPASLESVNEKWASELTHFCAGVPIILVACKKDLRDDPAVIKDPRQDGPAASPPRTMIGAISYLECSARQAKTAARASLAESSPVRRRGRSCIVV